MRQPVRTSNAPNPRGPYSQGVVASGRLLFVSSMGPVDPSTQEFVVGSVAVQTERVLRNLEAVAVEAGASLAQAVKTTVFLGDMSSFAEMNGVYEQFFPEPRPARTTVQAGLRGYDVAIDVVVALDA